MATNQKAAICSDGYHHNAEGACVPDDVNVSVQVPGWLADRARVEPVALVAVALVAGMLFMRR